LKLVSRQKGGILNIEVIFRRILEIFVFLDSWHIHKQFAISSLLIGVVIVKL
jgi:hypothetical protein